MIRKGSFEPLVTSRTKKFDDVKPDRRVRGADADVTVAFDVERVVGRPGLDLERRPARRRVFDREVVAAAVGGVVGDQPPVVVGEAGRAVPLLLDPAAEWTRPALTSHGRGNHVLRTERFRYILAGDERFRDLKQYHPNGN
jgi:hypothetical protein